MANEFDIFSIGVNDLDTGEEQKGGSNLYSPKPDQGQDGVYRSLIRFLPNLKNPRKPYIRKFVYWLEDQDGNGFYADSPSTVGEKCPVQDLFFKLRNSESAVDKKMSEDLKRREVYYALVQIVKDPQNRDLEGTTKIMKFGYKIKTKIDEELNPQFDEPTQIFDPFEGKNFELVISKKGGFPNYDSSKFQGTRSPMVLNGQPVSDSQESRKSIIDYLTAAPDLNSFDYKSWTDEERNKILGVLGKYTSPGSSISSVTSSAAPRAAAPRAASPVAQPQVEESFNDDFDMPSYQAEESLSDNGGDDNLDDFINGLDL